MNQIISTKIQWVKHKKEVFIDGKYSRSHIWAFENGNQIDISSSPQIVPTPYSNPEFMDPEEALICSLSSCHMLFFLSIAAKKRIHVLQYDDNPIGILASNDSNQLAITEITLQPKVITLKEINKGKLEKIHQLAHESCIIANSLNSKIIIKPQ